VALGLGMAVTVAPLTTTVMSAVGEDMAGVASGVNSAMPRSAALLAIAAFGLLMAWAFNKHLDAQLQAQRLAPEILAHMDTQRARVAAAALLQRALAESFVAGLRWIMAACAALALLSAVSAWIWVRRQIHAAPAGVVATRKDGFYS
jgi:hypothetical protein